MHRYLNMCSGLTKIPKISGHTWTALVFGACWIRECVNGSCEQVEFTSRHRPGILSKYGISCRKICELLFVIEAMGLWLLCKLNNNLNCNHDPSQHGCEFRMEHLRLFVSPVLNRAARVPRAIQLAIMYMVNMCVCVCTYVDR